ncbi:MAG: hypothetical protein AAF939_06675 [Planctomycetota bacterium]
MSLFSFKKSRELVDAAPKIRKLIDMTSPNKPMMNETRSHRRYNRVIPVLISDWSEKGPRLDYTGFGFTTDICDYGFGVISQHFPKTRDNVIGFYQPDIGMQEPWYFQVKIASHRVEPQNYIRLGYQIVTYLNDSEATIVKQLDQKLIQMMSTS